MLFFIRSRDISVISKSISMLYIFNMDNEGYKQHRRLVTVNPVLYDTHA